MKKFSCLMVGVALAAIALQGGIDPAQANTGPAGATFYANSPAGIQPTSADPLITTDTGTPLRKFVDSLPGLGPANQNNLGQYIPIAVADTTTYTGSDYYHLETVQYEEKVHSDLPKATKFRGYRDVGGNQPAHYLGPLILAKRDRPVRILLDNKLLLGTAGNFPIPVDGLLPGAGVGPLGGTENYTQNRTAIHLHGGFSPWISDGTPHQWFTPAGETTSYPKGASFQNVPNTPIPGGMPTPPDGSQTVFYTNQQSNRLMFFHEHALGITRLGVYSGMAAGYLLTDPVEEDLIFGTDTQGVNPTLAKLLPDQGGGVYTYGIPLIIQDRTFVPQNIDIQDSRWRVDNLGQPTGWGEPGDLWFPHVYEPNQDPLSTTGATQYGRWDYGPWFWPPAPVVAEPQTAAQYKYMPGMSDGNVHPENYNTSHVPEAFQDTMMVNGTAYPYLTVAPMPYRFRVLNACNDRFLNLQLYKSYQKTEVRMVKAIYNKKYPATWPVDDRVGGVPDPKRAGPPIIQIGSEGGFLPAPVVIPSQPVNYVYNRRDIVVLNVAEKALFMGPAERADIIIDFTKFKGKTLVLYNDAPAPVPGFDPRNDYYTGNPDLSSSGGAPSTKKGFGPNTRTVMIFKVKGKLPKGVKKKPFDLAALQAAWPAVYVKDQPPPIVPQPEYPPPWQATNPTYSTIQANNLTFTPVGGGGQVTMDLLPKALHELFDEYGRMNSILAAELPFTNILIQTTIPLRYVDPPNEILTPGAAQLWKITHNGVDTHPVHFHLVNVQVINRVGWDGAIRPPDPNELGWKETVRMNPLEDIVVAMKADVPILPFAVPNSVRPLDPTSPLNVARTPVSQFTNIDPATGQKYVNTGQPFLDANSNVINATMDFGWEYVWHCHILGHEENDMMRPLVLQVPPAP